LGVLLKIFTKTLDKTKNYGILYLGDPNMTKTKVALFLALLFGFAVFISCAVEGSNGNWEPKIYWTGTINDDFEGNKVLVVLDKKVGGPNKVHEKSFFGDLEIESIEDLSRLTGDINDKGINWEIWRQLLCLTLPGDSKANVVKAIRHLEKIDGIISAEPSGFARPR